ncbi:MAG: response regulator [Chloroflexi bacterium]|nr:response regulator [Chloroflexota bacterium]
MSKILLIDDETDFRDVLQREFADLGYQALVAPDGVRGLQMVMDAPIDVVVLDLNMPHRDGMETLRLIRAVKPEARVIVLTALMDDAAQVEARQLGVTDIMFKPVSSTHSSLPRRSAKAPAWAC